MEVNMCFYLSFVLIEKLGNACSRSTIMSVREVLSNEVARKIFTLAVDVNLKLTYQKKSYRLRWT